MFDGREEYVRVEIGGDGRSGFESVVVDALRWQGIETDEVKFEFRVGCKIRDAKVLEDSGM
jgi:hypothetical protein